MKKRILVAVIVHSICSISNYLFAQMQWTPVTKSAEWQAMCTQFWMENMRIV